MTEASMPTRQSAFFFALTAALSIATATAGASAEAKIYAVVAANNRSLDADVPPLRFADDDAVKYYEMLEAAGATVELLAVPDPDAQVAFPEAAKAALIPNKRNLSDALHRIFSKIEEDTKERIETHFMFIYSGHGDVGPNREGYINLLDAKFYRSDLFREVIAKSPASFNHVILDACRAYYMVNRRGSADKKGDYSRQVQSFLSTEEMSRYPNTGVILAASQESETHEWGKWASGIFSHELRSAMLGASDVNQDGIVTYDEAAACVEAANSSIEVQRARLKVYYRAPASKVNAPLMDLAAFKNTPKLLIPKTMAGRYYVEDSRGVRIADFNFSSEQPISPALPGKAPFFLRTDTKEANFNATAPLTLAANLTFRDISESSRGSVEQSFRKDLYKTAFGMGFYQGAIAFRATEEGSTAPEPVTDGVPSKRDAVLGWSFLSAGLAMGAASAITYAAASHAYDDYRGASTETNAASSQSSAENRLLTSRILLGVGSAAALSGIVFLVKDIREKRKREHRIQPSAALSGEGGIFVGAKGQF
jgi:hypothetical protein